MVKLISGQGRLSASSGLPNKNIFRREGRKEKQIFCRAVPDLHNINNYSFSLCASWQNAFKVFYFR